MNLFTVEEMNLICLFNYFDGRHILLKQLTDELQNANESELVGVYTSVIAKLEKLTDETFSQMRFCLADDMT